jgi:amino acid permease
LYVQIGRGLLNGGPASLFIAFTLWCSVILAVTLCMAEMVTYLPISSPFIRFAGRYGSEAFGFAVSTHHKLLDQPKSINLLTVVGRPAGTSSSSKQFWYPLK